MEESLDQKQEQSRSLKKVALFTSAVSACSGGYAITKCRMGLGLSIKHSQPTCVRQEAENSPWIDVACGVCLNLQCKVILGWLVESELYGLYFRMCHEHMLDLMFPHSQIRNTADYHFVVDL